MLAQLKDAGLGSLPGGGAEVFSGRVRDLICERKICGQEWLDVMRAAHGVGLKSNATMLYGHVETPAELADHMLRLRELQDDTGGFNAFIPLSFQPANTGLSRAARPDGLRRPQGARRRPPRARQLPPHQGLLDQRRPQARPGLAVVRGERPRRHRGRGEDQPRGRRRHRPGAQHAPSWCASSAPPAACRSSATRSTTWCGATTTTPA